MVGKTDLERTMESFNKLAERLDALQQAIDARFDRLKKIIIDYMNLGSDFAKGSLITALKQV